MRLYYIFSIKEDIYYLTKNNPEKLYNILNNIHKLGKKELGIGYKIFEKTCNFLDKKNINNLITNLNYDNYSYTCFRNSHLINDFYKNETTKLIVNHSHLQLKSNVIYPKFFNELKNLKNIFVCDFVNEDYFYLQNVKVTN